MKAMAARETLFPDCFIDGESGYKEWLSGKVSRTMEDLASGDTKLNEHAEAMSGLKNRLEGRLRETA